MGNQVRMITYQIHTHLSNVYGLIVYVTLKFYKIGLLVRFDAMKWYGNKLVSFFFNFFEWKCFQLTQYLYS
jgi:hypothetical protein